MTHIQRYRRQGGDEVVVVEEDKVMSTCNLIQLLGMYAPNGHGLEERSDILWRKQLDTTHASIRPPELEMEAKKTARE